MPDFRRGDHVLMHGDFDGARLDGCIGTIDDAPFGEAGEYVEVIFDMPFYSGRGERLGHHTFNNRDTINGWSVPTQRLTHRCGAHAVDSVGDFLKKLRSAANA